jgi:formate dehydrogenase subunit delta
MSASSSETLVRMANQIADFFKIQPEAQAVAGTANHIRMFWDPRMRAKIAEHVAHGGEGLNPIALKAVQQACKPTAAASSPVADAATADDPVVGGAADAASGEKSGARSHS